MFTVHKMEYTDMTNNIAGAGIATTIWFSGCSNNCLGCHNPQLHDSKNGKEYSLDELYSDIVSNTHFNAMNRREVVLLGGEPTEQDDIEELIIKLSRDGFRIWLYTGIEDIEDVPLYARYCYIVKTGGYRQDLVSNQYQLASTNQKLYIVDKMRDNYTHYRRVI